MTVQPVEHEQPFLRCPHEWVDPVPEVEAVQPVHRKQAEYVRDRGGIAPQRPHPNALESTRGGEPLQPEPGVPAEVVRSFVVGKHEGGREEEPSAGNEHAADLGQESFRRRCVLDDLATEDVVEGGLAERKALTIEEDRGVLSLMRGARDIGPDVASRSPEERTIRLPSATHIEDGAAGGSGERLDGAQEMEPGDIAPKKSEAVPWVQELGKDVLAFLSRRGDHPRPYYATRTSSLTTR